MRITVKRAAGGMKDPHATNLTHATHLLWNFLHCYVFSFFFSAAHCRGVLVADCSLMYDWILRVIYLSSIVK